MKAQRVELTAMKIIVLEEHQKRDESFSDGQMGVQAHHVVQFDIQIGAVQREYE
jgi:hypothetical protein